MKFQARGISLISGERVRQARELIGLTQTEFAKSIEVNQSAVAQIESGRISPSDQVLQRIVLLTKLPISFFKQAPSTDFPLGSLLFRSRASITLKERSEARQYARTVFEMTEKMEQRIKNKISLRIPRIDDDPKTAAIQTRSLFGLSPDVPIKNLINTLEKNGALVMALPVELAKRDAFSLWVGSGNHRPVIVITNRNAPGDRIRYSVAHELGHLVMHQSIVGDLASIEKEANIFASEFLMPEESMRREIEQPVTLASLYPLKIKWKVSIQALIP
jgi:Zn-dependent peptidase ImmA (M78 family)/DNA-binding XRE family transcriptional regulator